MKPILILDANAFIHNQDFTKLNNDYQFYSTSQALNEVKDFNARERLRTFPYQLTQRSPSDSAIKFIKRFAQETGDLASLSDVDIELISLAYTLIEENGKINLLRSHPPKPIEFNKIKNQFSAQQIDQPEVPGDEQKPNEIPNEINQQQQVEETGDNDDDEWMEVEAPKKSNQQKKPQIQDMDDQEPEAEENIQDDESDDDSEWITSENMFEHANGCDTTDSNEEILKLQVAVMSADYAMQNVLLQVGIPIVSFDGMRIKNARRFILECYVCKIVYRDSSKLFCSSCGNDTLLKVSCSVNSDGTLVLYRKKNFKINKRGNQYTIPTDLKLKDGSPFIMTEDQLLQKSIQQKLKRQQKQADYQFKKMMANYNNGFGFEEIDFKQKKAPQKIKVGFGRLNPNDPSDMRKIKKQM